MPVHDRMLAAALTAGWSAAQHVPEGVARLIFDVAGRRIARSQGPSVIQLARNLRRVLGDAATPETLADLVRSSVRSYTRYWRETVRLESADLAKVHRTAMSGTTGFEFVADAVDSGRGAVVTLPHSGNWDVAGLTVCREFGGLTTVAERLEPESIYRTFVRYRQHLGMEVLPLTGGEVEASVTLRRRLEQGKVVCLLGDRDLGAGGIGVKFFGEPTTMPAGPAMLAALTGADLFAVQLSYIGTDSAEQGWRQVVGAPLPIEGKRLRDRVTDTTQRLADAYAASISQHPADWHMMQPLWTADRTQPS